jgi:UBX domain-containing protein 1
MADETEDQPGQTGQTGQTAGQGVARTLGGQAVDTSLPEGWGRQERRTGRVGDWTGDQPARRPGG